MHGRRFSEAEDDESYLSWKILVLILGLQQLYPQ